MPGDLLDFIHLKVLEFGEIGALVHHADHVRQPVSAVPVPIHEEILDHEAFAVDQGEVTLGGKEQFGTVAIENTVGDGIHDHLPGFGKAIDRLFQLQMGAGVGFHVIKGGLECQGIVGIFGQNSKIRAGHHPRDDRTVDGKVGIAEFVMRTGSALLLPSLIGSYGIFLAEVLAWVGADLILIPSYFTTVKKLENR